MCEHVCTSVRARGRKTQRHAQTPLPGVTACTLRCRPPAAPRSRMEQTPPAAGGRKRPQAARPRPAPPAPLVAREATATCRAPGGLLLQGWGQAAGTGVGREVPLPLGPDRTLQLTSPGTGSSPHSILLRPAEQEADTHGGWAGHGGVTSVCRRGWR